MGEIRERYRPSNSDINLYIWKRLGENVDMGKTLEENGIKYDDDVLTQHELEERLHFPAIHLHFQEELAK
jgi:hypothetical protein